MPYQHPVTAGAPDPDASPVGIWRLLAFELEIEGRTERRHPLGRSPRGRLVLTADGFMIGMIVAAERTPGRTDAELAALFRTMLAYTGRYRLEGDRFVTTVDASWNEAWTGTEQARTFALDGDRLAIVSPWAPHPLKPEAPAARGILRWVRES
ncbi:MAG: lipocalin-like domain-containing protein [Trueperaceae bacterium]